MAYDKKLLADARRALERDRAARLDELEERRRDVYAREPRIRAIDRELSSTAAAVLKAAMESGGDPEAAIAQLRDRNLSLQEERARLLRGLGLPGDYLTDKPLCARCGDTGYNGSALCVCVKERYAQLLKEQLSAVLPIQDQNFSRFNMGYYSTRPDTASAMQVERKVLPSPVEPYSSRLGESLPKFAAYALHSSRLYSIFSRGDTPRRASGRVE